MARRVLIIDDDRFIAEALKERLEAMGYEATAVTDGASGLTLLAREADGSPVELVLLDLNMPGMDGMAVLRELRAQHAAIPVIMMSATPARGAKMDALRAGARDYLEKPIDAPALMDKCRAALGGGGG